MVVRAKIRSRRSKRQAGYMLLVVVLMVALLVLSLAASAPRIVQEIKRDRENEMIHRGVQYSRAIRRFYRKFGRYPVSIDQLKETNNMRFLRKEYADPMSPDGKWKLLHPGDVTLGGSNVGTPVASMAANTQQPGGLGGTTGLGGTSGLSSTTNSQSPQSGAQSGAAQQPGGTMGGGLSGFSSSNNPVIGGFIIGVASTSQAEGIHEFNGKSKYSEWYFIYDPTTDRGGGLISGPYTGKTFQYGGTNSILGATPAGQQPGGFGQQQGPGGLGQPGGMGQPANPGGFGQPIGPGPGTPNAPPKQ